MANIISLIKAIDCMSLDDTPRGLSQAAPPFNRVNRPPRCQRLRKALRSIRDIKPETVDFYRYFFKNDFIISFISVRFSFLHHIACLTFGEPLIPWKVFKSKISKFSYWGYYLSSLSEYIEESIEVELDLPTLTPEMT